ncbi:MAG: hypothetical protein IKO11_00105 [Lachnospiraceae bacterium]|nr:hypothetical protein [Lachnospiraceae bacterium]MCR4642113.1 hypothetical protein [Lachnospiraceae bacterium]
MQKYKIGDHVMYGVSGACEIVEIGTLEFAGPDKIYYSLKPVYDARDTIYVPVSKEDEIARKVIGKKKAQDIVRQIEDGKMQGDLPDRETCDSILQSADSIEVTNLIRQLRYVRAQNKKNHKGLNISDAKLLTYAERIVISELAVAFSITMDEAVKMLNTALG